MVRSVDHFKFQNEVYVLASGTEYKLDVFRLSDVKEDEFTGWANIDSAFLAQIYRLFVNKRPFQVSGFTGLWREGVYLSSGGRQYFCMQVSVLFDYF